VIRLCDFLCLVMTLPLICACVVFSVVVCQLRATGMTEDATSLSANLPQLIPPSLSLWLGALAGVLLIFGIHICGPACAAVVTWVRLFVVSSVSGIFV
jgi:hypothetical protein